MCEDDLLASSFIGFRQWTLEAVAEAFNLDTLRLFGALLRIPLSYSHGMVLIIHRTSTLNQVPVYLIFDKH